MFYGLYIYHYKLSRKRSIVPLLKRNGMYTINFSNKSIVPSFAEYQPYTKKTQGTFHIICKCLLHRAINVAMWSC